MGVIGKGLVMAKKKAQRKRRSKRPSWLHRSGAFGLAMNPPSDRVGDEYLVRRNAIS